MESQNILDEMIAEDPIEILKAAMPYLPKNGQRFASVYATVFPAVYRSEDTIQRKHSIRSCGNACSLQQSLSWSYKRKN